MLFAVYVSCDLYTDLRVMQGIQTMLICGGSIPEIVLMPLNWCA